MSNPAASASASTASRSRTPQSGSALRSCASNAALLGAVLTALAPQRSVEEQHAAVRQHARRAVDQRLRRRPRRDVDHVDAEYRVGARDRPGQADVERERFAHIGQCFGLRPGADRAIKRRIGLARLPCEVRQRGGEMRDVLPGAARDLQHEPGRRQGASQHRPGSGPWLRSAAGARQRPSLESLSGHRGVALSLHGPARIRCHNRFMNQCRLCPGG